MHWQRFSVRFHVPVFLCVLLAASLAAAQESSIYSFYSPYGDALPIGSLVADSNGNLYGTTFYGGLYGNGMVYELTPSAGQWHLTEIHSFNPNGIDGFGPTSGVIFDSAGNIYGTTEFGGSGSCTNGFGCGTVFELSLADGVWKETILHDFVGSDGWQIHPGLAMDAAGNLYGMATNGGIYNAGTAFELSPDGSGNWTFSVIHQFTGLAGGGVPYDALTLDAAGNLYGTASAGGGESSACHYGCGVVFELSPSQSGWTESVLHNFIGRSGDGHTPACTLLFDASGNLYGTTTQGGGPSNAGTVFELSPNANGTWKETVLHNFNQAPGDGSWPTTSLVFDASGNLYGLTLGGGAHGAGIAFKLTPTGSGARSESMLNTFSRQGAGGYFPNSGLIAGPDGNLYGVAASGGRNGQGTVFSIAP